MHLKQFVCNLPFLFRRPTITMISYIEVALWIINGRPIPCPHLIKVSTILKYARKFHIKTLVETGTYLGQTVDDLKHKFRKIFTIELDENLYKNAKSNFVKYNNITIIQGDSSEELKKVIKRIKNPTMFWLDAHYSSGLTIKGRIETPILKELIAISKIKIKNYVILIDDARKFTGTNDYPTIKMVQNLVKKHFWRFKMIVKEDIIRIYPYEN